MRNAKIKLHTAGIRPKLPIPRVIAGKKAADFNRTTPKDGLPPLDAIAKACRLDPSKFRTKGELLKAIRAAVGV
jgi:hypothetical protein